MSHCILRHVSTTSTRLPNSNLNTAQSPMNNKLQVALAQISPVWLNKSATIEKVESTITDAAKEGAELIVFGEGLLPGYPFWLALTGGAEWDTTVNKELHAHLC